MVGSYLISIQKPIHYHVYRMNDFPTQIHLKYPYTYIYTYGHTVYTFGVSHVKTIREFPMKNKIISTNIMHVEKWFPTYNDRYPNIFNLSL